MGRLPKPPAKIRCWDELPLIFGMETVQLLLQCRTLAATRSAVKRYGVPTHRMTQGGPILFEREEFKAWFYKRSSQFGGGEAR